MHIVSHKAIEDFSEKYADAFIPLKYWYTITKKRKWNHFSDLKKDFNSADYVGNNRFVFNIKGNDYRLVALILFKSNKVFIRFIGTHAEYDKIMDIENI